MKHVKVNGIWYKIAEDAEGAGYKLSKQPLRPPNSQLLQGENGKFQMRPDILQWSITDWSEGEGQIKFDPTAPGRSYIVGNASPFNSPGLLTGGPAHAQENNSGDTAFAVATYLVKAQGKLWALATGSDDVYEYDDGNTRFSAAETITSSTVGSPINSACGDETYLFLHETSTQKIHRRTSGGTWSNHNNQMSLAGQVMLAELGAYVYVWSPADGEVYEISKVTANTATPETPLAYTAVNANINFDQHLIARGENRIYIAAPQNGSTVLHEITPSSAAGTGFGTEIGYLEGFVAEAIWSSSGSVYMIGYDKEPDNSVGPQRYLMYVDPNGTYGTHGSIRPDYGGTGPSNTYPVPGGGRLAFSGFHDNDAFFELDQVTGGFGGMGEAKSGNQVTSMVFYKGKYFYTQGSTIYSLEIGGTALINESAIAISPANDFGLAGEKILEFMEVHTDPQVANGTIEVTFSRDGEGFSVGRPYLGNGMTVGDTGEALPISDSTTTYPFRSLQIKVKIKTGASLPVWSVVRSVDVYARVNRHLRVWDLLLDASDDAAPQGYSGQQIIENLTGIADNTIIELADRYDTHGHPVAGTAYSVAVDHLEVHLTQRGEGTIQLRLIETVQA